MGVHRTLPNTNKQKIGSKKNKNKKSLCPILFKFYYSWQQEMLFLYRLLVFKELLVAYNSYSESMLAFAQDVTNYHSPSVRRSFMGQTLVAPAASDRLPATSKASWILITSYLSPFVK